jgi:hypothetical protein
MGRLASLFRHVFNALYYTEASTKKNKPVYACANFLAWLSIAIFTAITAIPLPFYKICLLIILLYMPKYLFLSRMALKTRILPYKLTFYIPKLNIKEIIYYKGGNKYIKGNKKPTN